MSLILGQHAYGYVQLCLGWIRSLDADDNGVDDDDDGDDDVDDDGSSFFTSLEHFSQ